MTSKRRVYIEAEIPDGISLRDAILSMMGPCTNEADGKGYYQYCTVGAVRITAVGELDTIKREWIRDHLHTQLDALNTLSG
jgi:hypothetical protein